MEYRIIETEAGFYVQQRKENTTKWYNAIEYSFGSRHAAWRGMIYVKTGIYPTWEQATKAMEALNEK